jgi:hypothetical protein
MNCNSAGSLTICSITRFGVSQFESQQSELRPDHFTATNMRQMQFALKLVF